jgi:hypothetical protein
MPLNIADYNQSISDNVLFLLSEGAESLDTGTGKG